MELTGKQMSEIKGSVSPKRAKKAHRSMVEWSERISYEGCGRVVACPQYDTGAGPN